MGKCATIRHIYRSVACVRRWVLFNCYASC